jgi:thiol-disulfide isomerase/thioredoxin
MLEKIKKNIGWLIAALILLFLIGKYLYAQPKYINGAVAPNFSATMLNGSSMNLADLKGQYVVLDFWGSWCAPCLAEAPELKGLYDKFHGKTFQDAQGFEIVSVGIENGKDRWEATIQKMNLNWQYHVSDFKNLDSPIAQLYGVRVIPTKFLLNTEGVIIGVNQSVSDIDKFLSGKIK